MANGKKRRKNDQASQKVTRKPLEGAIPPQVTACSAVASLSTPGTQDRAGIVFVIACIAEIGKWSRKTTKIRFFGLYR